MTQRTDDPTAVRGTAIAAVVGGLGLPLIGVALGYLWMQVFPRPDFREPATAAFIGFLGGVIIGPGIGAWVYVRRRRLTRAGITGVLAFAFTWAGVFGIVLVGPLVASDGPIPLLMAAVVVSLMGVFAAAGGLARWLVCRRRKPTE